MTRYIKRVSCRNIKEHEYSYHLTIHDVTDEIGEEDLKLTINHIAKG